MFVATGKLALNWVRVAASTAACGRAFHAPIVTGRKECLNTSLLQWGRINLMLLLLCGYIVMAPGMDCGRGCILQQA